MQEKNLGGARTEQPGVQFRLSGRIKALKTQGGIVLMEGVVVGPGGFFAVADKPELALSVRPGEIADALIENGLFRLPGPANSTT